MTSTDRRRGAGRPRTGRGSRLLALAACALVAAAPAVGGEIRLSFDRDAVRDLLVAGKPPARHVAIPPFGEIVLRLSDPTAVDFVDGGLETRVPFAIDPLGLEGVLAVRYVPDVDPESLAVRLVPRRAIAEGPVRLPFDLAPYLPIVRLPRQTGWTLTREDGDVDLVVEPRQVRIGADRLEVLLGFGARRAAP